MEHLDNIIESYTINKPTAVDINEKLNINPNQNLSVGYNIFLTEIPTFLKLEFGIKPFVIKKNNPIIFFDTKKGKVSICFTMGYFSDEAFKLSVNGEKRNSFKNTKDLLRELPNYL